MGEMAYHKRPGQGGEGHIKTKKTLAEARKEEWTGCKLPFKERKR